MLKQVYGASDIFVMPNIRLPQNPENMEGFGIVVIEAGAAGVPVLAAELDGIRDAVIDDKSGYLVESSSSEAWKNKIEELIKHQPLSEETIKKTIQEHFSWQSVAEQYQLIFKDLIKEKHGTN